MAARRVVVPFNGIEIGQAFESSTAMNLGFPLRAASTGASPSADGQGAVMRAEIFTSQEQFEERLGLGVEVEARYGLFGGGAKFEFAKEEAINKSSTVVVASMQVKNALRFGQGFTPTPEAQALIAAGDRQAFRDAFGDFFCAALRTGGECYIYARITSSEVQHQSSISAALHAELNNPLAGGRFDAALQVASSDKRSFTSVEWRFMQFGGQGAQVSPPAPNPQAIIAHLKTFATAVEENPVAYSAELLSYDALGLPFEATDEDSSDKTFVLNHSRTLKRACHSMLSELSLARNPSAELIFENLPSPARLAELEGQVITYLNALMAHSRQVASGAIAPALFDKPLPVIDPLIRRQSTTFSQWFSRSKDGSLLDNERTLVLRVAGAVRPLLTVPIEEAPFDVIDRAANSLEHLKLNFSGGGSTISSLVPLSKMLQAPLTRLELRHNRLRNLNGLQPYDKLKELDASFCGLTSIKELAGLPSLEFLDVGGNHLSRLTDFPKLPSLARLHIANNELSDLSGIEDLFLGEILIGKRPNLDFVRIDRIIDSSALGRNPNFKTHPLTGARKVSGTIQPADPRATDQDGSFEAERVGDSLSFRFTRILRPAFLDPEITFFTVTGAGIFNLEGVDEPMVYVPVRLRTDIAGDQTDRSGFALNSLEGTPLSSDFIRRHTRLDLGRMIWFEREFPGLEPASQEDPSFGSTTQFLLVVERVE